MQWGISPVTLRFDGPQSGVFAPFKPDASWEKMRNLFDSSDR